MHVVCNTHYSYYTMKIMAKIHYGSSFCIICYFYSLVIVLVNLSLSIFMPVKVSFCQKMTMTYIKLSVMSYEIFTRSLTDINMTSWSVVNCIMHLCCRLLLAHCQNFFLPDSYRAVTDFCINCSADINEPKTDRILHIKYEMVIFVNSCILFLVIYYDYVFIFQVQLQYCYMFICGFCLSSTLYMVLNKGC